MNKIRNGIIIFVVALISTSLACKTLAGKETIGDSAPVSTPLEEVLPTLLPSTQVEPAPTVVESPASTSIDSQFPLPEDVQNFLPQGAEGINFQTGLNLEGALDFYRQAFSAQGLIERELPTVISEDVFSIVFDGAPNGKAVVVQGVRLESGLVNINIRYDDN